MRALAGALDLVDHYEEHGGAAALPTARIYSDEYFREALAKIPSQREHGNDSNAKEAAAKDETDSAGEVVAKKRKYISGSSAKDRLISWLCRKRASVPGSEKMVIKLEFTEEHAPPEERVLGHISPSVRSTVIVRLLDRSFDGRWSYNVKKAREAACLAALESLAA
eukprot:g965.t1